MIVEASRDLELEAVQVATPLTVTRGHRLAGRIGLVPILRAGLGMVEPVLQSLPVAEVWHLGFFRDEETLKPVTYYNKLPAGHSVDLAYILDPMLATGGSAIAAVDALRAWGVQKMKIMSLLAAPEGLDRVNAYCPEVPIHIAQVDECLNDRGFIVPGLGDAGDRLFNTLI